MVTNKKMYDMGKIVKKQEKSLSLKVFTVIFGFVLFLSSCEGFVDYSGTIYDVQTKEPLDSVLCQFVVFKRDNFHFYSDSLGKYYVSTPLVGCVPNCGEYEVEFSKRGYKTQIIKAPTDVYLEKE